MGLDSVELVIAFEEAFGVELMNEEAIEKTVTPRMVGDLIFSKLKEKDENGCQSQKAFYRLRKTFRKIFDVDRKSIRPDMRFRDLIPKEREKEVWEQIRTAIAARRWPDLERPLWMSQSIEAVGFTIFVATICATTWARWCTLDAGLDGIVGTLLEGISIGFGLGILLAFLFWLLVCGLTTPFAAHIPSRFQSVRDLIPHAEMSDRTKWTREGVSAVVKEIVIEQFGIIQSDYTEDLHFVEDFGLN